MSNPPSPITSEALLHALETCHDECQVHGCIHAEALHANSKAVIEHISQILQVAAEEKLDPIAVMFVEALHIGYRLGLTQALPADPTKVN